MFEGNKIGFILFTIVILIFIIGGYFLTDYVVSTDFSVPEEKEVVTQITDNRIDKTKDYIYFTDVVYPISGEHMKFQTVNININGLEYIATNLNSSDENFKSTIKYYTDVDMSDVDMTFSNADEVYSLSYREYVVTEYSDYVTLYYQDYDYNIENLNIPTDIYSYTIDTSTAKIMDEDDLLDKYDVSLEEVTDMVFESVSASAYNNSSINVSETFSEFKYILYINKIGSLEIIYLVDCSSGNYYDKLVVS
ncbi:MAG: hypothetical protein R3Y13_01680 [bacterium]